MLKAAQKPAFAKLPDKDLVPLCQAGDRKAFDVIIRRHQNEVLNLAYFYLRNHHQAWDAAQDVFLKVFKKIKYFQGSSLLRTWIYRITINHCIQIISREKHNSQVRVVIPLDEQIIGCLADLQSNSPAEEIDASNLKKQLLTAIAMLPRNQQTVIILYHYENLSYGDIARIMGKTRTRVGCMLFHARRNLKRILLSKRSKNLSAIQYSLCLI